MWTTADNSGDGGVTELDAVDEEETIPEMNIHDDYNVEYFYEDRKKELKRSRKYRKCRADPALLGLGLTCGVGPKACEFCVESGMSDGSE